MRIRKLAKKKSDRRGKTVKGGKQKNDDFYRIRISLYLLEVKQQNMNQIKHNRKYGINSIEASRLKNLLFNMMDDNWIEQIDNPAVHYPIYKLTELGIKITNSIKNLRDDQTNYLLDLECFANIKEIASGDE